MPIRIFTLLFNEEGRFSDEDAVNRFLLSKKLLDMRKEFFTKDGKPYWTVLVE